ncbi:efflux RND transporter periplasmic adaptor subunit [Aporhodopirellula aestuarii]|uniref:Efflux RND transporter periplasmic adaptor subunit n=1 Tax=Aporhodopirellula aestuarii TaxID=2950107 RepID=A0ABT0U7P3_9BACT|nr:efflux RND transporter periplasmic adaptor subunit [Aporhodopirellula aestuarii]MCM2372930.1 efflux RND transporter periplasmic adaptor subunit [Aporhodopirellula aestuarii]
MRPLTALFQGEPLLTPLRLATASILLLTVLVGCDRKSEKSKPESVKPAKVERLPVETELAKITLTEDANRRLGITTVAVAEREVIQRRTLGGQAVIPSGRTILVSAPLAGIVTRADDRSLPAPGTKVAANQPLFSLRPLLSAERDVPTPAEQVQLVGARANLMAAQTVAAGDVDRGKAEVEGAKIAFDRATQLLADRAGARRAVDDAEATLNIAKSNLAAAQEREKQLAGLVKMLEVKSPDGEATALPMSTPISGLINRIEISEGQTVAAGAVMFEVINTDTIWIRVPVFVDLLPIIQVDQSAKLVSLSGNAFGQSVTAKPIAAPPTADALSSSADLYYEVDNRELGLRPGQRIGVELPTSKAGASLVVPNGSIVIDIYGNTWVYMVTGEREYTRSRVSVRFVDGDEAILAAGPEVGTQVVVDGAAELFGTEFGAGK